MVCNTYIVDVAFKVGYKNFQMEDERNLHPFFLGSQSKRYTKAVLLLDFFLFFRIGFCVVTRVLCTYNSMYVLRQMNAFCEIMKNVKNERSGLKY